MTHGYLLPSRYLYLSILGQKMTGFDPQGIWRGSGGDLNICESTRIMLPTFASARKLRAILNAPAPQMVAVVLIPPHLQATETKTFRETNPLCQLELRFADIHDIDSHVVVLLIMSRVFRLA
ncbi:hypothetical protein I7I50_05422 [Histoplasma capsulatum G186AR]|uniref:Uncharacterized protein n=1 Tax=Ajellomyces capsulatus TaxID=5037 RepID=A0A8H7Z6R3_AJECA|nr:hypothetical protein I7I52_03683 [Histoplasma capsulatum]QSS76084.1 hypothetical protein I7I50_05422 [Histoplasma capsulatum G186AR]